MTTYERVKVRLCDKATKGVKHRAHTYTLKGVWKGKSNAKRYHCPGVK
jgi:hypothetical protein